MKKLKLFTDGSVHTQSKIGYGAYVLIADEGLSLAELKAAIKVKRFENTSSTKLELQAFLWALNDTSAGAQKITVYTDSQNIISLLDRRDRLERNNYLSFKNKLLRNHELYRAFYLLMDQSNCELIKIKGHSPSKEKDQLGRIFSLVDKAARQALRGALDV